MVFRFRAEGTEAALGPEAAEGSDFSFERHYKQKMTSKCRFLYAVQNSSRLKMILYQEKP